MVGRVIFLLEEPSMKALLEGLLPRLIPGWVEGVNFQCVPHQGKSDLDLSITRKLRGWRIPGDCFVIVRDNDNAECAALKRRIKKLCKEAGRTDTLVRLVCQELEGWYIGDLSALAAAFNLPKLDSPAHRKRFLVPDDWQKPSVEVKRLVPEFQKITGARIMGKQMSLDENVSESFLAFCSGVKKMEAKMRRNG